MEIRPQSVMRSRKTCDLFVRVSPKTLSRIEVEFGRNPILLDCATMADVFIIGYDPERELFTRAWKMYSRDKTLEVVK